MRILVTGASGRLGSYVLESLRDGRIEVIGWSSATSRRHVGLTLHPVDLADSAAVLSAIHEANPDVVIHAGGISSADAAHRDPARCEAVIVNGTGRIALWTALNARRLIFTSTDLVYDGRKGWYREDDPATPIMDYGRAKRTAENAVLAAAGGLVARISLVYGPALAGRDGFFDRAIASLRAGHEQTFFTDDTGPRSTT